MSRPTDPSPDAPVYTKQLDGGSIRNATSLYTIVCDEGWCSSIVCVGMYEWAADWLLEVLGRRPFAPEHRP